MAGVQKLLIAAIYAPAKNGNDKIPFFNNLSDIIEENKEIGENVIIIGDFNVVEKPKLDRYPSKTKMDSSLPSLRNLIRKHDLEDHWRNMNENKREYTFSFAGSHSRIDRIYTGR